MTDPSSRAREARASVVVLTALAWGGAAVLVRTVGIPTAEAPVALAAAVPASPVPLVTPTIPPDPALGPAPRVVRRVVVVRRSRAS